MALGRILVWSALTFQFSRAMAQFSPGELSKPHSGLEGTTNCTRCHEVGSEISGKKCLDCHSEIEKAIASKHGFHAENSSRRCVSCHKEHLGRNAQTVNLDRATFNHSTTGFTLTGKHGALSCEKCHQSSNIKDEDVLALTRKTGRKTMLGLQSSCQSCHSEPHKGTLGTKCESCHATTTWIPASLFDHKSTAFALTGKHTSVGCTKCHPSSQPQSRVFKSAGTTFADCSPCHASPHSKGFSEKACSSCHSTEGWFVVATTNFNHDRTGFPLRGKHTLVQCKQCHTSASRKTGAGPRTRCIDCHVDYHKNEFAVKYKNDCSVCHTPETFKSSTFTLAMHNESGFDLTGAHSATPCISCHGSTTGQKVFHFKSQACVSCHKDRHGGQFNSKMGKESCAHCHTTSSWKIPGFNHAASGFALVGKHVTITCADCHKPMGRGANAVVQYTGISSQCESCHSDPHAGQFPKGGLTSCSSCHIPEGWAKLSFDHNTQSAFRLTGAHSQVTCAGCHHKEEILGRSVIRFKPLPTKCETCHTEGTPTNDPRRSN